MINRKGEKVQDIPVCEPQFLAQVKNKYHYYDFKTQNDYHYLYDEESQNIEIIDSKTEQTLNPMSFIKISYLGSVL